MNELIFSVSDFVAVFNQTIEYAYPSVTIVGELANFRVSKGKWVYFDLKDEMSSVKFFGSVYQLPGPLEDGLMIQVTGVPRLHNLYGFSISYQAIQPVGEGSIKRAANLLEEKLRKEGLFDESRKRSVPYPPKRIGLIASSQSAAYADFIKIINERWVGLEIELADVQVQGEAAPGQIVSAIEYFNAQPELVDVVVLTRGGGSAEDLAAFSTEQVTRSVASSRVPTMVAIGHEVDISLAELAADIRASTPSNAAQFLVPEKKQVLIQLHKNKQLLHQYLNRVSIDRRVELKSKSILLVEAINRILIDNSKALQLRSQLLVALSPEAALSRGYSVIRYGGKTIRSVKELTSGQKIQLQLKDGTLDASIT